MKRALNKGVKQYVKLLWGKRPRPDSGRLVTRRFPPAHSAVPGQHQFAAGPTASGNVAPRSVIARR
jgi:hypothetical protein